MPDQTPIVEPHGQGRAFTIGRFSEGIIAQNLPLRTSDFGGEQGNAHVNDRLDADALVGINDQP